MLEDRSDAEVAALDVDRRAFALDLLLHALVEKEAQHRAAAAHLREAQHHLRLAHKHEDASEMYWTSVQIEHFQRVVPVYAERCRRYWCQWSRYWEALLQARMPEDLYKAVQDIADVEGRAYLDRTGISICGLP
jgi:hypothetical protein